MYFNVVIFKMINYVYFVALLRLMLYDKNWHDFYESEIYREIFENLNN